MNLRSIVESLPCCFQWKCVKGTAIALAVFNIFFIFLTFSECTVVELLAKLAFYGTIIAAVYTVVLSFVLNKPFPNKENEGTNQEFISQASVQGLVVRLASLINELKNYIVKCTSDFGALVKFLIICYFVQIVGGWFSFSTWVWIDINFLFALTAVKKFKGIQVADYIDSVQDIVIGIFKAGLNYIPKYKEEETQQ